ncbi:MAG: hypothetical protein ABI416_11530 [Ginsengibacter sp.]
MKEFLSRLVVGSLIVIIGACSNGNRPNNPVFGKWNSTWNGSGHKSIDFSISFESNHTFYVTAFGVGQTQPQLISGIYAINSDTITILDKLEEPRQLCNYADTGMYIFIRRSDTLLFKVIADACERRKLTLEIGLIESR